MTLTHNALYAQLKQLFCRTILFTQEQRTFLFILIREYTKSNFPLTEIMTQIERTSSVKPIKKIARLGKRNVLSQRPFSHNFQRTGYFTRQEEALLRLGETNNAMDSTVGVILASDEYRWLPAKILAPSAQWIFITIIMLLVGYKMGDAMRPLAGQHAWFFDMCNLIIAYIEPALLLIAATIPTYVWCRNSAGLLHTLMYESGIISLHMQITERRLLYILKELIRTQIPSRDIADVLINLFPNDKWLHARIKKAKQRLKEESLIETLDDVVSKNVYLHIMASAPNALPEEIASGMEMAINILDLHISKKIKLYALTGTLINTGIAALFVLPFMLITLGTGTADMMR